MDLMKIAPKFLRELADRLEPPEAAPSEKWNMEWDREFEFEDSAFSGGGTVPPPWADYVERYRNTDILDPIPIIYKKRYVYDRDHGDKAIHVEAEEYSDITLAAMTDHGLNTLDRRLLRKSFDIPFFQTELPPEGSKGRPYTFFLCDVSGSMSGIYAQHACALAQVAAEKVFAEGGVFVWMPYGSDRKDAVEFEQIKDVEQCLRTTSFRCGTTYIGENLKVLSFALRMGTAYDHSKGEYRVPGDFNKDRSKIIVVHDGQDAVEQVDPRIPVFTIAIANDHEELKELSRRTRGKYLYIDEP